MNSQAETRINTKDQAQALREASQANKQSRMPRNLRCIAIGSGKGGVGKTVVSISLAQSLSSMGYNVLILDADLGLANVDLQMGLEPKHTVQDVVFGNCSLEEAVIPVMNGPDVLASSSGATEMADMGNARRDMFINDLIEFAAYYDYFIIDVGAGIGKSIISFLSASPEVIVIVANEPTSIMDAYSLIKTLRNANNPPSMMMVVNMVRTIDEGEELANRLNSISKRFLGVEIPVASVITYDESVGDAIRARKSLMTYAPESPSAICIDELAKYVTSGSDRNHNRPKTLDSEFFNSLTNIGIISTTERKNGERTT